MKEMRERMWRAIERNVTLVTVIATYLNSEEKQLRRRVYICLALLAACWAQAQWDPRHLLLLNTTVFLGLAGCVLVTCCLLTQSAIRVVYQRVLLPETTGSSSTSVIESQKDEKQHFYGFLRRSVFYGGIAQYCLCCLLVLLMLACLSWVIGAHFGCGVAFHELNPGRNLLRHFYYTMETFCTVGYGDIYPNDHTYGMAFVVFCCVESVALMGFGIGVLVSSISAMMETSRESAALP
jgi:hypothetical protein